MDKPFAKIQFEKYIIKSIDFKLNPTYIPDPDESEIEIDIALNHKLAMDPNESKAELSLLCELSKEYEADNRPFYISIEIVGIFLYDTDIDSEDQKQLLLINGSAILFPYLRATISMITMLSSIPTFVLPTINIVNLIKNSEHIE